MNIDRIIFAFAGSLILLSVALTWLHSMYWLILAAFVGANLLQSSLTGFCPAASILKKIGVRSGNAF
jgi:Inner membrane protein YgaP-like, transmembrane domain